MSSDQTPAAGPFALPLTRFAEGVDLDITSVLTSFVHALADEFAEDPEGMAEKLADLSAAGAAMTAPGTDKERAAAREERDEIAGGLIAKCSDEGRIRIYRKQAAHLVTRVWALLGIRPVPQQRDGERGAA